MTREEIKLSDYISKVLGVKLPKYQLFMADELQKKLSEGEKILYLMPPGRRRKY